MKYLISFLIISFLLTIVGSIVLAQKAPETLEEAKEVGERILWGFPEALKKPWQEAVGVWSKIGRWFGNLWNSYIAPWLRSIWQRVYSFLGKEVEKRKPEIKEEFEKEKQEMREEVFRGTKTLWQRFKELIR